ncbi:MAG TPA: methylmalonyl-CoA mutase family protein, partial [Acidimicrobiales bacterium]
DGTAVVRSLAALRHAARQDGTPVVPAVIDCLRAEATLGEICDALRDVFGEHRGTTGAPR